MTLRNIEIFIAVDKHKNMSAAAKELYVTQPSISKAISDIENEYNITLFERRNKKLFLTPAGEGLIKYAEKILKAHKDMEEYLKTSSRIPYIKIGATATVGACTLSQIINTLQENLPNSEINFEVANTEIIERKLLSNDLDIALVEGKVSSSELFRESVIQDTLMLICPSGHKFFGRSSVSIQELKEEKFILRESGSGTRAMFIEAMSTHSVPFRCIGECVNYEAIKDALVHNLGITVISPVVVKRELERGELWACDIEELDLSRNFEIVYHKNKIFNSAIKEFITICREYREKD